MIRERGSRAKNSFAFTPASLGFEKEEVSFIGHG